jgi:hypothetical protein
MTEPGAGEPRAQGFDDPTRDIRLPRPAGSPPLVVRPEWSSYAAQPAAPPDPEALSEPEAPPDPAALSDPEALSDPVTPSEKPPRLTDQPTDELPEPTARPREPTLRFDSGAGFPRPVPTPSLPEPPGRSRKWPWVLLVLLPVVVIVGSGIWLFVLLSHG